LKESIHIKNCGQKVLLLAEIEFNKLYLTVLGDIWHYWLSQSESARSGNHAESL